jgi:glycosyltransferase involved in cell wall biosynthesis
MHGNAGRNNSVFIVVNTVDFFLSHRLNMGLELLNRGYEVTILSSQSKRIPQLNALGFKYLRVDFLHKRNSLLSEFKCLWQLFNYYRKFSPDIVHHVTVRPILYGSIVAWLLGTKKVINAISGLGHVFISNSLKMRFARAIIKPTYKFFLTRENVRVIFQNPEDKAFFISNAMAKPETSFLIKGAGVCMTEFFPIEPTLPLNLNLPKIILPSRMIKEKGISEFVEAAKILRERNVQANFVLVGGRDLKNPSALSENELNTYTSQGVSWVGHQENMAKVMQDADIVCLPSYREGLPKALIEAAACAKPIVTTDVPGCRDVVTNGENGFLVPVRDSKHLANALEKLIKDRDLRINMGLIGRQMVFTECSNESIIAKTMEVYDS